MENMTILKLNGIDGPMWRAEFEGYRAYEWNREEAVSRCLNQPTPGTRPKIVSAPAVQNNAKEWNYGR